MTAAIPAGWIVPEWPLPVGVHAACTTRGETPLDGGSAGVYQYLNLGDHVGDEAAAVAANRALVKRALGVEPVFMRQVHGARVQTLDAQTPDNPEADGCVTTDAGVACAIMVADCLPVLLAHESGVAIGAAHAGWRGLASGAVEAAVHAVAQAAVQAGQDGSAVPAHNVMAWLGPCIGPSEFEVGDEVKKAFEAYNPQAAVHFVPAAAPGKWLASLPGLARQRLAAIGVTHVYGNDGTQPWCTVSNASRFFSHRRDRVSGRFAAFIWRN